MDTKILKQLRAQAMEIDRGIMMVHSALGGVIRILEKLGAGGDVVESPNVPTSTIAVVMPQKEA